MNAPPAPPPREPPGRAPVTLTRGPWRMDCLPEDGARLSRLQFEGRDLLTLPPASFQAPARDYGAYETRPVYGYDDCWPTVDPSPYPDSDWTAPDHGELCWLPWSVTTADDRLRCEVRSRALDARFTRTLIPDDRTLTWRFEAANEGPSTLAFQHVMHPLMPLDDVECLALPPFETAWDSRAAAARTDLAMPGQVIDFLLQRPPRTATMLLLRGVKENAFALRFHGGPDLRVRFPRDRFGTLGIWWNRDGYPDQDGCRRNECAFEPISGPTSRLADACEQGRALLLPPHRHRAWTVTWDILAPPDVSA